MEVEDLVAVVEVCSPETQILQQIFLSHLIRIHREGILIHNHPEFQHGGIDREVVDLTMMENSQEFHRDQKILVGKNGINNGIKITHHQQDSRVNLIEIIREEEMNTKDY